MASNSSKEVSIKPVILDLTSDEAKNVWVAKVKGGQIYTVQVNLLNNDKSCSCQDWYYRGHKRPCKHLMAVLKEIQRRLV